MGLFKHVRGEFLAAVFVASVVVILGYGHLLDDLQQDTLQLAVPIANKIPFLRDRRAPDSTAAGRQARHIRVALIDDLEYENRFRQESPLDRAELTKIIDAFSRPEGPRVLAIDLDLSPGPSPSGALYPDELTEAERGLYRMLKLRADEGETSIVLITPQPVLGLRLAERKAGWMSEMCAAGVRFGLPAIPSSNGFVYQYSNTSTSFAGQAARETHSPQPCDTQAMIRFTHKLEEAPDPDDHGAYALINFKFAEQIEVSDFEQLLPGLESGNESLHGEVVFLGGHYGTADFYDTPVRTLSGVQLHAASLYSMWYPSGKVNHLLAYLLEILLGTMMGLSVYKLTSIYRDSRSIASIVVNVLFQPLVPYFMLLVAGLMLRYNIWLNPAPIIFGMAIHATLVSSTEPTTRTDPSLRRRVEQRIKHGVYGAVVIAAWGVIGVEMLGH